MTTPLRTSSPCGPLDRHRLPGQGGLVERAGREQPAVDRHDLAGADDEHVAGRRPPRPAPRRGPRRVRRGPCAGCARRAGAAPGRPAPRPGPRAGGRSRASRSTIAPANVLADPERPGQGEHGDDVDRGPALGDGPHRPEEREREPEHGGGDPEGACDGIGARRRRRSRRRPARRRTRRRRPPVSGRATRSHLHHPPRATARTASGQASHRRRPRSAGAPASRGHVLRGRPTSRGHVWPPRPRREATYRRRLAGRVERPRVGSGEAVEDVAADRVDRGGAERSTNHSRPKTRS